MRIKSTEVNDTWAETKSNYVNWIVTIGITISLLICSKVFNQSDALFMFYAIIQIIAVLILPSRNYPVLVMRLRFEMRGTILKPKITKHGQ